MMPTQTAEPGGMVVGQTANWMVARTGKQVPATINLQITAIADHAEWRVIVPVYVPRSLHTDDLGLY
jgi:hypothetical protein